MDWQTIETAPPDRSAQLAVIEQGGVHPCSYSHAVAKVGVENPIPFARCQNGSVVSIVRELRLPRLHPDPMNTYAWPPTYRPTFSSVLPHFVGTEEEAF
jgi:hypothetical protein